MVNGRYTFSLRQCTHFVSLIQVRDVGKHIRHAPGLEVTDDDLKVRLTDLKTLFADPTFNKENPLAQDALDQLDQLEKDKLVIRPSDIEAALDLKKVVVELGSGLERKASALGDVLDCKTDEGVNAIQDAKDRAIQDISGLSEEKQASFKSDLNKTLIKYHRENNSTLTLGHFLETIDGLDDFYIPPNISIVIPQSMQTYETSKEHTTKPLENLEQLFSSKGIIILTADAGVGKTSFCKFLVASWCKVQEGSADVKPMTSYETSAFVHAVQIQHVESHLPNPMFALQLLCVYHNKRSENKTFPTNDYGSKEYCTESYSHTHELTSLGKTRSHVYANMIELMLRSAEKKDKSLVQGLSELYKTNDQTHALPECFDERNYTCCALAKLLVDVGKLAAYSLLDDNKSLIEEHRIRKLTKDETTVLLKSGLLSNTSLKTISEERRLYTFLHQTYKEMLACVFLSSQDLDSDVWKKGGVFYSSELIDYQSTITLTHKECSDNGVKTPRIWLKHALLGKDSGIGPHHALLQES
ncbi:hypothetical protein MAR_032551, partial [Mya arenaria]